MTDNKNRMYELAGVKKVGKKYSCKTLDFGACRTQNCDICDKAQDKNYPPFTEFKQLKLIKILGLLGNICITKREYNGFWCITTAHKNGMGENESFDEALAMLIYNIWDCLSLTIQEEIRKVLR